MHLSFARARDRALRRGTKARRSPNARQWLGSVGASALLACAAEPTPSSRSELDAGASWGEPSEGGQAGPSDFDGAAAEADSGTSVAADAEAQPVPGAGDADADAVAALAPSDAGTPSAAARSSLIVPSLWLPVALLADPFDDRPDLPRCAPSALMAELLGGEPAFSVNTGDCDYVTLSQPTQRGVAAGERIKVRLWHFELNAPEPAEAHAAVLVDGLRVLDERLPIPQPGALISRELRLTRSIPAGALVHFHLHNHGANSWALVEVSAGP